MSDAETCTISGTRVMGAECPTHEQLDEILTTTEQSLPERMMRRALYPTAHFCHGEGEKRAGKMAAKKLRVPR